MNMLMFFCVMLIKELAIIRTNASAVNIEEDAKRIWDLATNLRPHAVNTKLNNRLQRNPCDPVKVPDFRLPGHRISHTKCLEYIWDIKYREDKVIRDVECKNYRQSLKNNIEGDFMTCNESLGGRNTLPGEFPHMGAIGWKSTLGSWIFKCGGSLISNKFVLTAGHCSKASKTDTTVSDVDPKIVRFGTKNIEKIHYRRHKIGLLDVNILRIINHPDYKPPKKNNDIALIELQSEVTFTSFVQPACLYTGSDKELVGKKAYMTGWEWMVKTVNYSTSSELQAVLLDVLDKQLCDNLLRPACYRFWCGLTDNQMCAGVLAGGTNTCQVGTGGPLQIEITLPQVDECVCKNKCRRMHQVIGVSSFGSKCGQYQLPEVYTRVSSFLDWIEGIVWK